MPEITETILKGLEAIKIVKIPLNQAGWEIYRVETDRAVGGYERLILFLSPIKEDAKTP